MSETDPLPPGWERGYSRSQSRTFYFYKQTKHTQWHFPTASEAKDPSKAKKRADMYKELDREKERPKRQKLTTEPASAATDANDFLELADATSIAIIVPYRDVHAAQKRAAHLRRFVPHMIAFLSRRSDVISNFHIYVIEQSDDQRKFNRGKLLNIGFDLAKKSGRKHDVFIFHDVDLLPHDDLGAWYAKFPGTLLNE
jgi:hypothetical protein